MERRYFNASVEKEEDAAGEAAPVWVQLLLFGNETKVSVRLISL